MSSSKAASLATLPAGFFRGCSDATKFARSSGGTFAARARKMSRSSSAEHSVSRLSMASWNALGVMAVDFTIV